jgi:hypothetical protein
MGVFGDGEGVGKQISVWVDINIENLQANSVTSSPKKSRSMVNPRLLLGYVKVLPEAP